MARIGWVLIWIGAAGCPKAAQAPPPAATDPAAGDPAATDPAATGTAATAGKLLTIGGNAEGCPWRVFDLEARAQTIGHSASCPEDLLWDPSGAGALYRLGDQLVRSNGPPLALPSLDGVDPIAFEALWVAPPDDRIRTVAVLEARVERTEAGVRFSAGPHAALIPDPDADPGSFLAYGVRDAEVVAAGSGDREVSLPPWGLDVIVAVYEHDGEAWTTLAAFPSRTSAGDTPGIDVAGAFLDRAPWPALSRMLASCATTQDCEAPPSWSDRPALREAAGLGPVDADEGIADEIGFLAAETGGGGWLFRIAYGDTPHAFGPVSWCADDACDDRTPLLGIGDGQLSIVPQGRHVAIAEEFTGAGPRVYAAGTAEAIFAVPDAEASAWIPEELPIPTKARP